MACSRPVARGTGRLRRLVRRIRVDHEQQPPDRQFGPRRNEAYASAAHPRWVPQRSLRKCVTIFSNGHARSATVSAVILRHPRTVAGTFRAQLLSTVISATLAACNEPPASNRTADHADRGRDSFPRYWLRNTTLLTLEGRAAAHVDEPLLVELLPGGRVRSVNAVARRVEGYLPKAVLEKPTPHGGLMLYAQQVTDLRYMTQDGPVIGRLYPGAFVSVVKRGNEGMLVGSLPFRPSSLVGYVAAKSLGTLLPTPQQPSFGPGGKAFVSGMLMGPTYPSVSTEELKELHWWPCEPVWFERNGYYGHQYVDGVEIVGLAHTRISTSPEPRHSQSLGCPASAVIRRGAQLTLETERVTREVSKVPSGFKAVQPSAADALRDAIQRRESIFWLVFTGNGPSCSRWRFANPAESKATTPPTMTAALREVASTEGLKAQRWYPVSFVFGDDKRPARLEMDPIQPSRSSLCCEFEYVVVGAEAAEFHLLGRRLPEGAVAYSPSEAERWYRTFAACDQARVHARQVVETAGHLAPALGAHISRGIPRMRRDVHHGTGTPESPSVEGSIRQEGDSHGPP